MNLTSSHLLLCFSVTLQTYPVWVSLKYGQFTNLGTNIDLSFELNTDFYGFRPWLFRFVVTFYPSSVSLSVSGFSRVRTSV